MRLSLVAAVARNRVIGREGGLPWRLPADLRNFRRLTLGHPVLMGRRTWDSLGRALPGRDNLVLSRDPAFAAPGGRVVRSVEEAIAAAGGAGELMVIGGAALFAEVLPRADRQYLSWIHEDFPGDVRYPDFDPAAWREVRREDHPRREPDSPHPWTFVILERVEEADARGGS